MVEAISRTEMTEFAFGEILMAPLALGLKRIEFDDARVFRGFCPGAGQHLLVILRSKAED